jgi:hypothetical protein
MARLHVGLSYWASGGLWAGGWAAVSIMPCMNQAGYCKKKITVQNLLYCSNFSYYCRSTWRWAVRGGCPRKCAGHQPEPLRVQVGTGMGTSGSATLFGREPYTERERVDSVGADRRARTVFGCRREVEAWT